VSVLLLAAGVALLALPRLLRPIGRAVSPNTWARWCVYAIWLGMLTVAVGLATMATPTVLRAVGVPALARACERTLAPLRPGGPIAGWLAASGAVWLAVAGFVGFRRARRAQRRAFVEPCVGEHDDRFGVDVVVLPTDEPLAYSVSAGPAQIVLTSGLVERLAADELDAVLRHELAHLRRNHQRYITVAVAAETAFGPLAHHLTGELRLAIERAADEDATAADPRRRGLLRAVLLAGIVHPRTSLATLSPVTVVAERIDALGVEPARASWRTRLLLHSPAFVVTATAGAALSVWGEHVTHVIAMAGRCAT
jgi:Zn-dependent protease with chaperone function